MAQGSKQRKLERNRAKCAKYRATGRREANKARRVARDTARGERARAKRDALYNAVIAVANGGAR